MKYTLLILTTALLVASPLTAGDWPTAKAETQTTANQSRPDIVAVATSAGQFNTLSKALEAADLLDVLRGEGPFTVFAPTDAAFAKLPKGTIESLLQPENKAKLQQILKYHVLTGKVSARKAAGLESARTLGGEAIKISLPDGRLKINQADVIKADLIAANGVIHVIDEVLIPGERAVAGNRAQPRELIRLAIDRGVPLFNDGQTGACAAIYEVAAVALLQLPENQLSPKIRKSLATALAEGRDQAAAKRAWTLRKALDQADTKLD